MVTYMSTEPVQIPSIPSLHVLPPTPRIQILRKSSRAFPSTHPRIRISSIREYPSGFRPLPSIQAAERSSGLVDGAPESGASRDSKAVDEIKAALYQAFEGTNRGIFGVQSGKKSEIEGLVKLLESQNPNPDPTENLEKVDGCWKLVYSTISILGTKRTKLGLRDFVALGDFLQFINVAEGKAINVIKFSVRGLKMFTGQLVIVASFRIATKSRVDIKYENSSIAPDQLMNIFQKNYDLLLAVFNPEGWLEISYIDESMRIGRDDKGNIFILVRSETEKAEDYAL
ncbi:hypothetical protein AAC387_Pa02g0045 [Persea americana]